MELLAPAGNIEMLKCAVASGANAVYLGLDRFNARLKADNFTSSNINEWVDYCHLFGVKVYLTLNTMIKTSEIDQLIEVIHVARNARVDALIVSDMATLLLAKKYAPFVAIHASTQMGIHNVLGAKFLERLGVKRVVLAREATLSEIRSIKSNTKLEVEYFVHGALCVSLSGGCLLSSIANGNSGNRGGCLQLCRKEYHNSVSNTKGYFLSPKDQCMLGNLGRLEESGVDSIKIEGRLKSNGYVVSVVSGYAKALAGHSLSDDEIYAIKVSFNRGNFTQGYSFEDSQGIIYPHLQGHYGYEIGSIENCRESGNKYIVSVDSPKVYQGKYGVKIVNREREVFGGEIILEKGKGRYLEFLSNKEFAIGSKVRITSDPNISTSKEQPKLDIVISFNAAEDKAFEITVSHRDFIARILSDYICPKATNNSTSYDEIAMQLSKLGGSYYQLSSINGVVSGEVFIPKSILNQTRRQVLDKLYSMIIERTVTLVSDEFDIASLSLSEDELISGDLIEIDSQYLPIVSDRNFVVNYDNNLASLVNHRANNYNIFVKLPKLALDIDIDKIVEVVSSLSPKIGIYADNYYAIELANSQKRRVIYGFGLNIANSITAEFYRNNYCISPELNKQDSLMLANNGYVYSYGYLPVMTLAHCPYSVASKNKCNQCGYQSMQLTDNFGSYKLERIKIMKCQFIMYNNVCHNINDRIIPRKYIDIRHFNRAEITQFIDKNIFPINPKTTQGHNNRGVE